MTNGRWRKGQSGNRRGRPKRGEAWTDLLREYGEMTVGELRALAKHPDRLTAKRALAVRQLLDGLPSGRGANSVAKISVAARVRQVTFDRVDGRPGVALDRYDDRAEKMEQYLDEMGAMIRGMLAEED